MTTVPLYALTLGGNTSTAGTFMTVICLTALILRPVLGNLMDVKPRRIVLTIGSAAMATAVFFYGLAASIAVILCLAVVHGLAVSALTTSAPTVVADITPPSRLAEGISIYGIAMNVTLAMGPLAALYLINNFNYSTAFKVALIVALLGIALTFLIDYEKKSSIPALEASMVSKKIDIKNLFEKTAIKPSVYQLLMSFGASSILTFIPIYATSRGVENIGMFFTIYAGSAVAVSLVTGKLVQKYGTSGIFVSALLLQLVAFIFLAFAQSLPLMIAAAVFYGVGSGAGSAIINILGMEAAPSDRRGAANATMFAAMDIGYALGASVLGLVSTRFGFTATFILTAIVLFSDIIVFHFLNKEKTSHYMAVNKS